MCRRRDVAVPIWKTAVLSWTGLYPVLLLLDSSLASALNEISVPIRLLVSTAILMPVMSFLVMPALEKLFSGWLRSSEVS